MERYIREMESLSSEILWSVFCVVFFLAVMPTGASLVFFCETAWVTSDIHRSVKTSWWSFQIDSSLIQWHTVIVRLTALWSNGIQASSDWQRSDPMAYRHRQIDSALIQWYTGIIRLTALWSNGTQASSDWQRSRAMMLGIQWGGSHISGWLCHSLSQPCYNVVLIGAPSAGGALGHRLARLCLEMVLLVNTENAIRCQSIERQYPK